MGYPTDILDLYSDTMPNLLLDRGKSQLSKTISKSLKSLRD